MPKMIAVNYEKQFHHLDHIAVIAILMNIPLKTWSSLCESITREYYPEIDTFHFESLPENKTYLMSRDVIFDAICWTKDDMDARDTYFNEAKKVGKPIKHVHCPHGFSDKAYWFDLCIEQDYFLVYGQNMLKMFEERNLLEKLPPYVITGNYRYQYYLKHKDFYQEIVNREIFSFFKNKGPIVLYAPSYNYLDKDTSFFDAIDTIIEHLPKHYNLLVKMHPDLIGKTNSVAFSRVISKYLNRENVFWLNNYPLVYPILDKVDIYLGDTSSIAYDFLAFNKPLFFLKQQDRKKEIDRGQRFNLGTVITPENYNSIWKIIENTLPIDQEKFGQIRAETYHFTFGNPKPFEEVRAEILRMLEN